jgi:tRNA threonylcarbamoyladenosine biosynthesis protein TsaB
MTNILLIETATMACSVGISRDGEIIALRESMEFRSHAEMVSVFIAEVMNETGFYYTDLHAVAVSKGPGSYTGLRIGVSTAKGICYGADLPLIAIETLAAMTSGFIMDYKEKILPDDLFCPMIDARRMEVYCRISDISQSVLTETEAIIVDDQSFKEKLANHRIWFFGDGAAKTETIIHHPNAMVVKDFNPSVKFMAGLAQYAFNQTQFENVAYFEPFYLKDFVAALPKVKGLS